MNFKLWLYSIFVRYPTSCHHSSADWITQAVLVFMYIRLFDKFMGTCQNLIACLDNLPDTLAKTVVFFLNMWLLKKKNEYKNDSDLYGINSSGRLSTLYSVRLHAEEKIIRCNFNVRSMNFAHHLMCLQMFPGLLSTTLNSMTKLNWGCKL